MVLNIICTEILLIACIYHATNKISVRILCKTIEKDIYIKQVECFIQFPNTQK